MALRSNSRFRYKNYKLAANGSIMILPSSSSKIMREREDRLRHFHDFIMNHAIVTRRFLFLNLIGIIIGKTVS